MLSGRHRLRKKVQLRIHAAATVDSGFSKLKIRALLSDMIRVHALIFITLVIFSFATFKQSRVEFLREVSASQL